MPEKSKFRAGQTLTIGLAFFASEISWALYNAQIPLLLGTYVTSFFIIGLLMALDNMIE